MENSNFKKVLGAAFIFDGDKTPIAISNENGKILYKNDAWEKLNLKADKITLPKELNSKASSQELSLENWPTQEVSESWLINTLLDQNEGLKGFLFRGKKETSAKTDILEYHKMINASKDGLTLINRDYRYKLCNEAFTRNKDLISEQVLGKTISEVWGEVTFLKYIKPNLDDCFKGKTVNYQLWIQFSKSVRRYMDVTYWPYWENSEVTHVVVNSRDITDMKIVEMELKENLKKAEMAAAVKSQFLSNMSHEIRTPLNGIIGTLSLFDLSKLNKDHSEFIDIIKTSSTTLLSLVNDLLDHAKIEAGKMDLDLIRFSPRAAIIEITELFNYLATSKGIKMQTIFDNQLPEELYGDPGRLKQVLSNLISNALKFTDKGEVKVSVEYLEKDENDLIPIRFKIIDSGKGIDPIALGKLFQPFEQGDSSINRRYGGTGLGLNISKNIVELMNGEIGVSSTPGVGSEFWFIARFEEAPKNNSLSQPIKEIKDLSILCYHKDLSNLKGIRNDILSMKCEYLDTNQEVKLNITQAPDFIIIYETSVNNSLAVHKFYSSLYPDAHFIYISIKGFRGESKKAWDEGYKAYLTGDLNLNILENTFKIILSGTHIDQIVTRYSSQETLQPDLAILVCEDNIINQRLILKILNGMEYRNVDLVDNGLKAIKAAKEKRYDLILMDLRMPELSGLEATKLIRESSKNENTFIVAITGDAVKETKNECILAGMDDFLAKPYTKNQLKKFINQLNIS